MLAALRLWFASVTGRQGVRERHEALADAARRKAEREGLVYDAYPGAELPPKTRLVMLGGPFMERVDLDGYDLRQVNLTKGSWRREWLVDRIRQTDVVLRARVGLWDRQQAAKREERRQKEILDGEAAYEAAVAKERRSRSGPG